jgi:hypothetical protein
MSRLSKAIAASLFATLFGAAVANFDGDGQFSRRRKPPRISQGAFGSNGRADKKIKKGMEAPVVLAGTDVRSGGQAQASALSCPRRGGVR